MFSVRFPAFSFVLSAPFTAVILLFSSNSGFTQPTRSGAEILIESHLAPLEGKKVGLLLNQSSRVGPKASSPLTLDTLLTLGVDIQALFAPEHGIRGDVEAGGKVADGVDPITGLPIYSLYGSSKQPPSEILEELDVILFDIQDVGARFYTYISTMGLLLDAALPAGVDVWVLDRPNPAGGEYISGWMLNPEFTSFVGLYPVPMVHGMTLGELAIMMVGEGWAGDIDAGSLDADDSDAGSRNAGSQDSAHSVSAGTLNVIPMEGWHRSMLWTDTGRDWVPPSPNLPTFEHAYVYLGTCLVEGTTLSEGRGTEDPFLLIGSSTLNLSAAVEASLPTLPGATISITQFIPKRIPGKAEYPKQQDLLVNGIRINLTDPSVYQPVESGLELLRWLLKHDPQAQTTRFLHLLAGDDEIQDYITSDSNRPEFSNSEFRILREPYLIY